jgi:hypothetical protein
VLDGTYPLNETRKAIERVASGRTRGTIVIDVAQSSLSPTPAPNSMALAGSPA